MGTKSEKGIWVVVFPKTNLVNQIVLIGTMMSKKKQKNEFKNNSYRLISNPKQSGGVLPLIPIFAGLSALGSLTTGSTAVYNTIRNST